jgi:heat shock protein 1/8
LSTSINRMRFDGLASSVYRQVGATLSSIVQSANLDLSQIDEVLLAGSSTLFPGLQSHLSILVPPTTPVTAVLEPSEIIAVGCALQALHLTTLEDGLTAQSVLEQAGDKECLSAPVGLVIPGLGASDELTAKIFEAGAPLPSRRRVALPVDKGVSAVVLEVWEGKDEVKVTKVEAGPRDEDDEDSEEEDDEELKTAVTKKSKLVGAVEVKVGGGKEVVLEVTVQRGGGVEVRAWEEGKEEEAVKFEA